MRDTDSMKPLSKLLVILWGIAYINGLQCAGQTVSVSEVSAQAPFVEGLEDDRLDILVGQAVQKCLKVGLVPIERSGCPILLASEKEPIH